MTASQPNAEQDEESDDWSWNPTISYRTAPLDRDTVGTGTSNDFSPRGYDHDRTSKWDDETVQTDELPPEHQPDVSGEIEWSEYRAYRCRFRECQDQCLNPADSPYADTKSCRHCYVEKDPDPKFYR